jgi:DNA-directed RNA polymerase
MPKIISLEKEFINKANKKIQFAAFCIAIKNYELDNKFLVKLPIFLDATCSGIQHLSAMLQDINLGAHVNLLTKTEDDDVNDLYQTFVDPINDAINKFGKENTMYSSLKNIKLDRKIIKTPIMTGVYSVTVDGIYRQLIKKFKKTKVMHPTEKTSEGKPRYNTYYDVPSKKGDTIKLLYVDVYRMAEIIKNASFNAYPSLKEIYSYFIDSAKLMLELKIPIVWFTPAGLEISQFYYTSIVEKVKLSYFGKTRTSVIRE